MCARQVNVSMVNLKAASNAMLDTIRIGQETNARNVLLVPQLLAVNEQVAVRGPQISPWYLNCILKRLIATDKV